MRARTVLQILLASSSTLLCTVAAGGVGHGRSGAVQAAEVRHGRKLDLVIVHYHVETLQPMLANWTRFLESEEVKTFEPTVFVYSTNSDIDLNAYKPIIGEHGQAVRLPNVGREGRPYMAHILAYWDNFADHTLFSQAMAQSQLGRFPALFTPGKTGMLALAGYAHQPCKVDDGWLPPGQLVQLFGIFTRRFCSPDGYSSMYSGQFLVSRKRIQAQPWDVWEYIEGLLAAPNSHWLHLIHKHKHHKNETDPFFGHAMERSWSLAFNCYDLWRSEACWECDKKGWSGCQPEDCQCFD